MQKVQCGHVLDFIASFNLMYKCNVRPFCAHETGDGFRGSICRRSGQYTAVKDQRLHWRRHSDTESDLRTACYKLDKNIAICQQISIVISK